MTDMARPLVTIVHGLPDDPDHVSESREMNDTEYAQYQMGQEAAQEAAAAQATADAAAQAKADAAAQAKADAARAVLEKLGITEDVLNVLHGAISAAPTTPTTGA